MEQFLRSLTALPNLHPAVVHFPIAFLPLALVLDLAAFLRRSLVGLERMATGFYALGALSAGVAFWAGRQAADGLSDLPPSIHVHISEHSDWALYTLWTFAILAVLRIGVAWRERRESVRFLRPVKLLILMAGIFGQWLIFETADRGGALVYRYGVAVARTDAVHSRAILDAPPQAPNEPAEARLVRSDDGSLSWTPLPGDAAALVTVLTPGPGFSPDAVVWEQPEPGAAGLGLEVEDRVLLLLHGMYGDVHIEALIDFGSFSGKIGLAHHVRSEGNFGLFAISTEGEASLSKSTNAIQTVLDSTVIEEPSGVTRIGVSITGRHLKGMVGGKTVIHGHTGGNKPGRCGLLLEGRGVVRVMSMQITPL